VKPFINTLANLTKLGWSIFFITLVSSAYISAQVHIGANTAGINGLLYFVGLLAIGVGLRFISWKDRSFVLSDTLCFTLPVGTAVGMITAFITGMPGSSTLISIYLGLFSAGVAWVILITASGRLGPFRLKIPYLSLNRSPFPFKRW